MRIVCLGGSTTFSTRVGNHTTYPRLLERKLESTYPRLQVEIINAGAGGYTSAESLINLQLRVLDLKPDLIIVYHAVNDIHPRVVPGFEPDYSHYRRAFTPSRRTISDSVAEWSTLFACLRYRFLVEQRNSLIRMTTKVPSFALPVAAQEKNFASTSPATFRRNIQGMADCARTNGIDVVLSTFTWCKSLHERQYTNYHSASYYQGFEEHNAVMREIARSEGLLLVDIAHAFPSETESLFSGPVHLNSAGTEIKASLFHDALVAGNVIERIAGSRSPSANVTVTAGTDAATIKTSTGY